MLSREQFEAIEAIAIELNAPPISGDARREWFNGVATLLGAIRSQLVLKVEVSPTATATGTIEGLDGLGRRVGEG